MQKELSIKNLLPRKLKIFAGNIIFTFRTWLVKKIQSDDWTHYADRSHISSHFLFDKRQELLQESDFACCWCTRNLMTTSPFCRCHKTFWKLLNWCGWTLLFDLLSVGFKFPKINETWTSYFFNISILYSNNSKVKYPRYLIKSSNSYTVLKQMLFVKQILKG